ncbi:MAG: amidohydrolase [Planctomycetes bacterium]|nr:amidohydrolase [Planctomycetota bacterium]MCH9723544.1 amidohydrolase [Planctomycetota bacterium]MCH9775337.1 amidohydrolase [Planctomycetota bacterium]MCH9792698.1 amidohydrolase [Planctomycetota bacterium]
MNIDLAGGNQSLPVFENTSQSDYQTERGLTMHNQNLSRRGFLLATGTACCSGAFTSSVSKGDTKGDTKNKKQFKKIDCHLHINHKGRSIEDTIKHMDATGTEKAFILPLETGEGGVVLRTETVLHAFHKHKDRLIPFCQTDIRKPDVIERIRAYHLLGCRGIGEQKEHLPLNDRRVEAVIALCDEFNWPITIHFQDNKTGFNQGIEQHLETYLKKYQHVRIIGHAQSFWSHISADVPSPEKTLYPTGPVKPGGLLDHLLSEYPNLYADMSAGSGFTAISRDENFSAGFLQRHRKQLLFGSDCPCYDGRGANFKGMCYSTRLQQFLQRMVKDESALRDIFYNNAERALNGTT